MPGSGSIIAEREAILVSGALSAANAFSLTPMQKYRSTAAHPRLDLRARGQRHAAKESGAPRRGSNHAEQHARGLVDVVEFDQPALLLHSQPVRQRHNSALNSIPVERSGDVGKLAGLLQHHAL